MLDDRFAQVSHPSLFGPLSSSERHIEERLRTISMCICASGVVIAGLIFFRFILVPLVLAVALKYLLMPVIDALSVRPLTCCGRTFFRRPAPWVSSPLLRPFVRAACLLQLPRPLAILVAIGAAFAVLGLLGVSARFAFCESSRTRQAEICSLTSARRW